MLPELRTSIPGPRSAELAGKLRQYESRNVTWQSQKWPIFWEKADGANVWDADGNRFLDFTSAFGVCSLGHNALAPVVREQAGKLLHAMGDVHPAVLKAELCMQLSKITFEKWGSGPAKTILGNSGFEAVEAALKTALLHTGKPGVIAFQGAYHGLGFGALATCGLPFFQAPFRPQLKDFATLLPFPEHESALPALEKELERIAQEGHSGCVLVEPIQGRGGCIVPPAEFLPLLRKICDRYHLLLIADEIFTGFHRTGTLFTCDHSSVVPDILCLGKALTGGFPLSACVGKAKIMDAWPPSSGEALHTSTFLGNPLGCAMALESLRRHADPATTEQFHRCGEYLRKTLASLQSREIGKLRGKGLMLGLEILKPDGTPNGSRAVQLVQEALQNGLLLLADSPDSHVLSICPPFVITEEEIDFLSHWLQRTLSPV